MKRGMYSSMMRVRYFQLIEFPSRALHGMFPSRVLQGIPFKDATRISLQRRFEGASKNYFLQGPFKEFPSRMLYGNISRRDRFCRGARNRLALHEWRVTPRVCSGATRNYSEAGSCPEGERRHGGVV